jgi:hypothetical protein
MNRDILKSVVAGHRQVTVYITAGNIGLADEKGFGLGKDPQYPLDREEGAIAGYSKLLQIADAIKADASHFHQLDEDANPPPQQTFQFDSRYPASCGSTCIACVEYACELSTAGGAWVDGSGSDERGQRVTLRIHNSRPLNAATNWRWSGRTKGNVDLPAC